ncbi:MAG: hypothetical protein AAF555_06330 [Verrucomicrobiota bacterium]
MKKRFFSGLLWLLFVSVGAAQQEQILKSLEDLLASAKSEQIETGKKRAGLPSSTWVSSPGSPGAFLHLVYEVSTELPTTSFERPEFLVDAGQRALREGTTQFVWECREAIPSFRSQRSLLDAMIGGELTQYDPEAARKWMLEVNQRANAFPVRDVEKVQAELAIGFAKLGDFSWGEQAIAGMREEYALYRAGCWMALERVRQGEWDTEFPDYSLSENRPYMPERSLRAQALLEAVEWALEQEENAEALRERIPVWLDDALKTIQSHKGSHPEILAKGSLVALYAQEALGEVAVDAEAWLSTYRELIPTLSSHNEVTYLSAITWLKVMEKIGHSVEVRRQAVERLESASRVLGREKADRVKGLLAIAYAKLGDEEKRDALLQEALVLLQQISNERTVKIGLIQLCVDIDNFMIELPEDFLQQVRAFSESL